MATRQSLPALQASDFTSAFPNSRKVYFESGDLRVPAREITLGGDLVVSTLTVPATGGIGSTLAVSDTTRNQGAGSVGPSTTRFRIVSGNTAPCRSSGP